MARIKHGTLTADTVATVILGKDYDSVEVMARGDSDIFFRVDKVDPTVEGEDSEICSAGGFLVGSVPTTGNTEVRLISTDATSYTVSGV